MPAIGPLSPELLPPGVRARFVDNGNGLSMHVLEAGHESGDRPLVLLLHGFPEIAYSWRYVIPALAAAGWHVVAPDQRGYGRTTGWTAGYDDDLAPFFMLNLVRDILGLVAALGHRETAVVGHDYGSPVAAACALVRPDVFRSVVIMSAPFGGTPPLLPDPKAAPGTAAGLSNPDLTRDLAALARPRKHYQWYYSTRPADADMRNCPEGIHAFLRAYFHMKSADWTANQPHRLEAWRADEIARLPTYYVMDLEADMPATVRPEMPSAEAIAGCRWLPDEALAVYAEEYGRIGFQGGLQWYRVVTGGHWGRELKTFAGRTIDVPSAFIAGASDWGIYQKPGDFERMQNGAMTDLRGVHVLDGAGHWVQQEQADKVSGLLVDFLAETRG
ncbi:alpha/beta hydrolase [Thalassobaculum fulvum]|uniref:Alpha/beta hydrolase n=1 Tax=Thalassobaculum fulvum TaxID=1633335 RepID=A0A919CQQ0_9PROT|nr:alpha/beta hydrolase [Thalassobaculum fulvum]GHD56180.1 alpha/beta hydrolase [Thalassobaculum fulvum]